MTNARNDGTFLFLIGMTLLAIVGLVLYFGVPMHIAKSKIEGWNSYNSVARTILGSVICAWAAFPSIIIMIGGVEHWFQRAILPSWLTMWQKQETLREQIISLVAKALGMASNKVGENTRITNLYAIIPHIGIMTGKSVYGKKEMTVGELLEQVT